MQPFQPQLCSVSARRPVRGVQEKRGGTEVGLPVCPLWEGKAPCSVLTRTNHLGTKRTTAVSMVN